MKTKENIKKLNEIEVLLNELHNDMAKSIIDMKTYKPLSTDILIIKDKICILKKEFSNAP